MVGTCDIEFDSAGVAILPLNIMSWMQLDAMAGFRLPQDTQQFPHDFSLRKTEAATKGRGGSAKSFWPRR